MDSEQFSLRSLNGVAVMDAGTVMRRLRVSMGRVQALLVNGTLEVIPHGFGKGRHAYLVESVDRYQRERRKPGNPNFGRKDKS